MVISVADPGGLYGSFILYPGSRILDPGFNNNNKEEEEKI
jgi:hypothetical protein